MKGTDEPRAFNKLSEIDVSVVLRTLKTVHLATVVIALPSIMYVLIGLLALQSMSMPSRGNFLAKYSDAIERYIMTGYGQGWKHCDLLSVGGPSQKILPDDRVNLQMDIKTLETYDLSILASSYCLLVVSDVNDMRTLQSIIQFGWKCTQYKRIGVVLKLGDNVTLDGLQNRTKLPFVVATESPNGKEQFLCPVVGESEPVLQSVMCEQSLISYKGRQLRISLWPYFEPYATFDKLGKPTGVDMKFLNLLQERIEFKYTLIISTPWDLYKMV